MSTYKEQKEIISDIEISDGESKRIDCPFCFGKYTFTLTKKEGQTFWNCYKASCESKGAVRSGYGLSAVRNKLLGKSENKPRRSLPLPRMVSHPRFHTDVINYLKSVNCFDAYRFGWADIKYDPVRNRVLFYMNEGKGAVGRALDYCDKPKWLSYGDTSGLYVVDKDSANMILVEDAASACSVSRLKNVQGCALLGTNVSPEQRKQILQYETVTIILDKDASRNAIKLLKILKSEAVTTKVTVKFTEEDLKYLSVPQIKDVLGKTNES